MSETPAVIDVPTARVLAKKLIAAADDSSRERAVYVTLGALSQTRSLTGRVNLRLILNQMLVQH